MYQSLRFIRRQYGNDNIIIVTETERDGMRRELDGDATKTPRGNVDGALARKATREYHQLRTDDGRLTTQTRIILETQKSTEINFWILC